MANAIIYLSFNLGSIMFCLKEQKPRFHDIITAIAARQTARGELGETETV